MSYVPPHKRLSFSSSSSSPSPTHAPQSHQPRYNKNPHGSKKEKERLPRKIIVAKNAVSLWFPVGIADNSQLPNVTHFQPFDSQLHDQGTRENKLILVLNDPHAFKEVDEDGSQLPWDYIAENVQPELISAFERVKKEKIQNEIEDVRPTLVVRFGEIVFQGGQPDPVETTVTNLARLKKSFDTNVSSSYMDHVINEVVSKLGLHFEHEKELYHIKLSDNENPESTLSCKCFVSKDPWRLELFKVELNQLRHFVADMSCLAKDLDLRLMLCTKRIMISFTDNEIENIKLLISYATLDPKVKGGLRWPLGKDSSRGRYTVCGVWHTTAKTYRNSSIRLKVCQADRFDFRTSKGENAGEVILKMRGIVSLLQEPAVESELASQMLKDNLRLVWKYCLDKGASSSTLM